MAFPHFVFFNKLTLIFHDFFPTLFCNCLFKLLEDSIIQKIWHDKCHSIPHFFKGQLEDYELDRDNDGEL